jgi:hypothetical protein
MKNLLFIIFMIIGVNVFSQVAINTDGLLADTSAMLDVKSTAKGMLVPRMSAAQRDAIAGPATGLLIFCTDDNLYYSNKGTPLAPSWVILNSKWISNGSNISFTGGNVSIGTTTPDAALSVASTSLAGIGTTGSFQIGQSNTYNLVCDNNEVQARYNGSGGTLYLQYWGGDISACQSGGTATFYGTANMSSNLIVSGRLGIKKSSPAYDLDINSTSYSAAYIYGPYNGGTLCNIVAGGTTSGTWGLYSYATTLGYAAYFSGNIYCTGSYLPSDEKLKENMQPLENALDKIMQLKINTYYFKPDYAILNLPTSKQYGFTAQNLESVFPELVRVNPAKAKEQPIEFKAVNYIGLIPILTEAIQEQQVLINARDEKIGNLQKQYDDLQVQFNDLKAIVLSLQQNR